MCIDVFVRRCLCVLFTCMTLCVPTGHLHTSLPVTARPLPSAHHPVLSHAADWDPGAECCRRHVLPAGGAAAEQQRASGQTASAAADHCV